MGSKERLMLRLVRRAVAACTSARSSQSGLRTWACPTPMKEHAQSQIVLGSSRASHSWDGPQHATAGREGNVLAADEYLRSCASVPWAMDKLVALLPLDSLHPDVAAKLARMLALDTRLAEVLRGSGSGPAAARLAVALVPALAPANNSFLKALLTRLLGQLTSTACSQLPSLPPALLAQLTSCMAQHSQHLPSTSLQALAVHLAQSTQDPKQQWQLADLATVLHATAQAPLPLGPCFAPMFERAQLALQQAIQLKQAVPVPQSVALLAAACSPAASETPAEGGVQPFWGSLQAQLPAQLGSWPADLLGPWPKRGNTPLATIEELVRVMASERAVQQGLIRPALLTGVAPHLAPWLLHLSPRRLVDLVVAASLQFKQGAPGSSQSTWDRRPAVFPAQVASLLRQTDTQLLLCVQELPLPELGRLASSVAALHPVHPADSRLLRALQDAAMAAAAAAPAKRRPASGSLASTEVASGLQVVQALSSLGHPTSHLLHAIVKPARHVEPAVLRAQLQTLPPAMLLELAQASDELPSPHGSQSVDVQGGLLPVVVELLLQPVTRGGSVAGGSGDVSALQQLLPGQVTGLLRACGRLGQPGEGVQPQGVAGHQANALASGTSSSNNSSNSDISSSNNSNSNNSSSGSSMESLLDRLAAGVHQYLVATPGVQLTVPELHSLLTAWDGLGPAGPTPATVLQAVHAHLNIDLGARPLPHAWPQLASLVQRAAAAAAPGDFPPDAMSTLCAIATYLQTQLMQVEAQPPDPPATRGGHSSHPRQDEVMEGQVSEQCLLALVRALHTLAGVPGFFHPSLVWTATDLLARQGPGNALPAEQWVIAGTACAKLWSRAPAAPRQAEARNQAGLTSVSSTHTTSHYAPPLATALQRLGTYIAHLPLAAVPPRQLLELGESWAASFSASGQSPVPLASSSLVSSVVRYLTLRASSMSSEEVLHSAGWLKQVLTPEGGAAFAAGAGAEGDEGADVGEQGEGPDVADGRTSAAQGVVQRQQWERMYVALAARGLADPLTWTPQQLLHLVHLGLQVGLYHEALARHTATVTLASWPACCQANGSDSSQGLASLRVVAIAAGLGLARSAGKDPEGILDSLARRAGQVVDLLSSHPSRGRFHDSVTNGEVWSPGTLEDLAAVVWVTGWLHTDPAAVLLQPPLSSTPEQPQAPLAADSPGALLRTGCEHLFAAGYSQLSPHTWLRLAQVYGAQAGSNPASPLAVCMQLGLAEWVDDARLPSPQSVGGVQQGQDTGGAAVGDDVGQRWALDDPELQLGVWLAWACARLGTPLSNSTAMGLLQHQVETSSAATALVTGRASSRSRRARHKHGTPGTASLCAALQQGAVMAAALTQDLAVAVLPPTQTPDRPSAPLAALANTAVTAMARASCAAVQACRDFVLLRQTVDAWTALGATGPAHAYACRTGVRAPLPGVSAAPGQGQVQVPLHSLLTTATVQECRQVARCATLRMRQLSAVRQRGRARRDYTHVLF